MPPKECLQGVAAPISSGLPAWGTEGPALAVVAAQTPPAGDGSPHWRGPSIWGDRNSCLGGGRCLKSACGRWQPPSARVHQLEGQGALPKRQSLLKECLRGTAAPIGAGLAGGEGPAQAVVAA